MTLWSRLRGYCWRCDAPRWPWTHRRCTDLSPAAVARFRELLRDVSASTLPTPENPVTVVDGIRLVNVHDPAACAGRPCVIHAPTDHHMRGMPLHWRDDRGIFERICEHHTGHPDPDQYTYWSTVGRLHEAVHGCCGHGCCRGDAPDILGDTGIIFVCATCGTPTESEPCEEHQPSAWARMVAETDGGS